MYKVIAAFIFGAGIGSIVTWKYVEDKCQQKADEEVRDIIKKYIREETGIKEEETEENDVKSVEEYEQIIKNYNYASTINNSASNQRNIGNIEPPHNPNIKIITPDEYGELDDYSMANYTYYADGQLVDDEDDQPVEDIEGTVGLDFADHFGEYGKDSVYIRNVDLEIDIEIIKTTELYGDVY